MELLLLLLLLLTSPAIAQDACSAELQCAPSRPDRMESLQLLADRPRFAALLRRGITDQLNVVCCNVASNCAGGLPERCSSDCAAVRASFPWPACVPVRCACLWTR